MAVTRDIFRTSALFGNHRPGHHPAGAPDWRLAEGAGRGNTRRMRLMVLSDHVADMRAERQSPGGRAAGDSRRELAAHRRWVAEAVELRDLARQRRRPVAWLRLTLEARRRMRARTPVPSATAHTPA